MKIIKSLTLAVVLPLLVLGVWWFRIDWGLRHGRLLEFPVSGYDPRDLLSGHFLTYRVDYTEEPCMGAVHGAEQCVCFEAPSNAVFWSGTCAGMPANCGIFLKGSCNHGRFEAGIERFYFPEQYAGSLQRVPPNAAILVAVDGSGHAVVRDFLVEGRRLQEWVRKEK